MSGKKTNNENIFVIPIDMENRPVSDIAREAAVKINAIVCQVGKRREAEKRKAEGKGEETE